MVSVELRPAPVIDEYVSDIAPDLYGAFWQRRRIIAALYAIALGYEPAAFGLSRDDIPPAIDVSALVQWGRRDDPFRRLPAEVDAPDPGHRHDRRRPTGGRDRG